MPCHKNFIFNQSTLIKNSKNDVFKKNVIIFFSIYFASQLLGFIELLFKQKHFFKLIMCFQRMKYFWELSVVSGEKKIAKRWVLFIFA